MSYRIRNPCREAPEELKPHSPELRAWSSGDDGRMIFFIYRVRIPGLKGEKHTKTEGAPPPRCLAQCATDCSLHLMRKMGKF